ncbi:hypothetical protein M0812_27021 [Anaeramoeba flamelloides]|uniref:Uncharacterized protein n=1 Tax=Anaeramoeba flamelloides TaxID=1746091 RepID=A0AAV7YHC0_9EUKA|nr:hypothetical protein M0812_27021 [Anaeramoeba flamelloides]
MEKALEEKRIMKNMIMSGKLITGKKSGRTITIYDLSELPKGEPFITATGNVIERISETQAVVNTSRFFEIGVTPLIGNNSSSLGGSTNPKREGELDETQLAQNSGTFEKSFVDDERVPLIQINKFLENRSEGEWLWSPKDHESRRNTSKFGGGSNRYRGSDLSDLSLNSFYSEKNESSLSQERSINTTTKKSRGTRRATRGTSNIGSRGRGGRRRQSTNPKRQQPRLGRSGQKKGEQKKTYGFEFEFDKVTQEEVDSILQLSRETMGKTGGQRM